MFQSIVNIFSNSPNLWNVEHLQKVLKIPQDQLKELENIPGWTSGRKETIKDKTEILSLKKTKESTTKSTSGKVKSKKATSSNTHFINLKSPRILLQENNIPLGVDKPLIFSNNKRQSSLGRSFSLSSLDKLTCFNNRLLKRSSSTSSINSESILNFNSNNCEKMSNIIHTVLKEPFNRMLPLASRKSFTVATTTKEDVYVEKSQFINSAVQCQMSQCSQSEFESNDNVVIANETADIQVECSVPVTPVIPSSDSNFALETKIGFPRPIHDDKKDNHVGNQKNHSPKIIETNKSSEEAPKFHVTDVEESFISQPIPCAQPLLCGTTSISTDLTVCTNRKAASSFEIGVIHNTSGKVSEDISEKKNNFAAKRKRKNKQEKLPKKFRTMRANEIELLYSSDQIQSMIEVIKYMTYV